MFCDSYASEMEVEDTHTVGGKAVNIIIFPYLLNPFSFYSMNFRTVITPPPVRTKI